MRRQYKEEVSKNLFRQNTEDTILEADHVIQSKSIIVKTDI